MAAGNYDVFISYRRENGSAEARLLRERLVQGGWRVFLDVTDLKKGYFDEALLEYIAGSPNFLVVLSPRALERCSGDQDWLRREIEQAIATDRNIIPVMLPGFQWPEALPPSIASLPRHQGLDYSHVYFDAMIARIDESIRLERDEAESARRERERERKEREDRERELKQQDQVPGPKRKWAMRLAGLAVALGVLFLQQWYGAREAAREAARERIREGRAAISRGNYGEALEEFSKVPPADPSYKDALRGQVDAYKGAKRWSDAEASLHRLIRLDPSPAYARELVEVASGAEADSKPAQVPGPLSNPLEVESRPDSAPEAKPVERPAPAESKSKAWQMVHAPKEDDEAIVRRAKELAQAGKLDEAEGEIRRALRISPNVVSYRFMRRDLAEVLEKKGDLDGALREMAIAVKLWPKDAWYEYNYYGKLLEKKGDLEAALAQYKIAAQAPAYRGDYERLRDKMGR